jgi:hypothetical protein
MFFLVYFREDYCLPKQNTIYIYYHFVFDYKKHMLTHTSRLRTQYIHEYIWLDFLISGYEHDS